MFVLPLHSGFARYFPLSLLFLRCELITDYRRRYNIVVTIEELRNLRISEFRVPQVIVKRVFFFFFFGFRFRAK